MKLSTVLAALCLFISISIYAQPGKFSFKPEKPFAGEEITVTFNSANTILEKSKEPKMYVLQYSDRLLFTDQYQMSGSKGQLKASFTTDAKCLTAIVIFTSEKGYETNNGEGYVIYMNSKNEKPIPETEAAYAVYRGSFSNLSIVPNYKKALELFESAFKKDPAIKDKFRSPYYFTICNAKPNDYKTLIGKELDLFAAKKNLTDNELNTLAAYYRTIGDTVKEATYTNKLRKVNPGHRLLQFKKMIYFFKIKDLNEKIEFAKRFKEEFPNGEMNADINASIASTMLDNGDLLGAYDFWNKNLNRISISFYNKIAWRMYEKEENLAKAAEIAETAVKYGRNKLAEKSYQREDYMTKEQAEYSYKYDLGYLDDTYGSIMLKLNNKEEAYKAFEEAFTFAGRSSEGISENYLRSLLDKKEYAKAKEKMIDVAGFAEKSEKFLSLMKEIYSVAGEKGVSFEQFIADIKNKDFNKIIEYYKAEMINERAENFTLTDLSGQKVSLSDFRGKIVLVDFWSTTCGPCMASLPIMKVLVPSLEKEFNVKYLFINTQEGESDNKDKLEKLVNQNQYPFHILLDTGSVTRSKYGVLGIPTTLMIDPKGFVRFRDVGFGGTLESNLTSMKIMIKLIAGSIALEEKKN